MWVVCGVLSLGCGGRADSARAPGPDAQVSAPRKVELVRVESVALDARVVIAGTLAPDEEVTVKSKVPGRLVAIDVDLGTPVKAGQRIAQLEMVDYRLRVEQASAALGQAKAALGLAPDDEAAAVAVERTTGVREATATLDEARGSFERARALLDKKLIGRADFDTASATLLRAESAVQRAREDVYARLALLKQRKAELGLARQQLDDATLRAPFDGVVQTRHASPGAFLAAGADVATLVRVDPLRLRVEIPEREAMRVAREQRVSVRVDGREAPLDGRIARLSPMLSQLNRTLVVEAEIANPGDVRPGSFARAEIEVDAGAPVLAIPSAALVVFAGIEKVILVADGKAVEKPILTGQRSGDLVEVREGLAASDAVVLAPGTLQQGQAVEVTGVRPGPRAAALPAPDRGARIE
ncbi:MAG: efflux RND transporter periplasmic adaptor subunit [Polyangiales bacterium]